MIPSRSPKPEVAFRSAGSSDLVQRDVEARKTLSRFKEALRNLGVRQESVRTFMLVLAVTAFAKGAAFLPGYAIDDYLLVLRESPSASMLGQGRFGQALLVQLMYHLRLEPSSARAFFVTLGLVGLALLATLVVRHWSLERKGWLAPAVAVLVANHPYTTEIFTFRTALGTSMMSLALFALLLIPRRWTPKLLLLGTIYFAFLLSIYQVVLHFSLMIVLMGMALWLTRVLVAGGARGWPDRVASLLSPRKIAAHRQGALLACTVLGTIVYVVVNWIIATALDVTLVKRGELIGLADVRQRVQVVGEVLRVRLLADALVPAVARNLLLLLLLCALIGLLVRTRPRLRLRPQLLFVTIVTLFAAALVWTVGLILVLQDFWPTARVMSHSGIFWGGVLAIAYCCSGPAVRWGLALLSLVVGLSFIGASNQMLSDQIRLNVRDAMTANRIVARLEASPDFREVGSVAIHGTFWRYPLGFRSTDHDMNISAFGADWGQLSVLQEISGYDLKPAVQAEKDAAAAYCQGVKPWPGPQSVAIRDRLAIICLGPL